MQTLIPLHALVLDALPSDPSRFPDHEVVRAETVAHSLAGVRLSVSHPAVMAELLRRAEVKIRLGERAVIPEFGLPREARAMLGQMARTNGVPAIWLLPPGTKDRDLARGDGVAEVVVAGPSGVRPALPMGSELRRAFPGRSGFTVIGDVHGMHQSMLTAFSWARARNHAVIMLGDVVDYGHATLDCADEAWRMVTRGEGAMVLGNHERKIGRYLTADHTTRHHLRMSEGNKVTVAALQRLAPAQREAWVGRFRGLLWHARSIRTIGPVVVAHAAIHPRYWEGERDDRVVEDYALFGEPDSKVKTPRFATSYRWVDAIPKGRTVIVGHDVRSTEAPRTITGSKGGVAIFLDTGCGKGGVLSSADIRIGEDDSVRVVNLNVH